MQFSYPFLLKLGPFSVTTLGVMICFGFFTALFILYRKAQEEHLSEDLVMDVAMVSIVSSLLGGRIFFGLVNGFGLNGWDYFRILAKPGFSLWGILIGILLTTIIITNRNKIDFFKMGDIMVLAAPIFQIFIAIGRYLDGSSVGSTLALGWFGQKIVFTHQPALYEIIFLIVLSFVLNKLVQEYRTFSWYKGKKGDAKTGFITMSYLLGISCFYPLSTLVARSVNNPRWIEFAFGGLFLSGSLLCLYLRSGLLEAENIKIFTPKQLGVGQRMFKPAGRHIKTGIDAKKKHAS